MVTVSKADLWSAIERLKADKTTEDDEQIVVEAAKDADLWQHMQDWCSALRLESNPQVGETSNAVSRARDAIANTSAAPEALQSQTSVDEVRQPGLFQIAWRQLFYWLSAQSAAYDDGAEVYAEVDGEHYDPRTGSILSLPNKSGKAPDGQRTMLAEADLEIRKIAVLTIIGRQLGNLMDEERKKANAEIRAEIKRLRSRLNSVHVALLKDFLDVDVDAEDIDAGGESEGSATKPASLLTGEERKRKARDELVEVKAGSPKPRKKRKGKVKQEQINFTIKKAGGDGDKEDEPEERGGQASMGL